MFVHRDKTKKVKTSEKKGYFCEGNKNFKKVEIPIQTTK